MANFKIKHRERTAINSKIGRLSRFISRDSMICENKWKPHEIAFCIGAYNTEKLNQIFHSYQLFEKFNMCGKIGEIGSLHFYIYRKNIISQLWITKQI